MYPYQLLRPYVSNGDAVDPQSFILVGGQDEEFEIESITDYGPKKIAQKWQTQKGLNCFTGSSGMDNLMACRLVSHTPMQVHCC